MKQSNLKIAITGGIGSGKSTVSDIIAAENFPVFSCDKIYGELLKDKDFLNTICLNFGEVLNSDGSLNRQKLADIVFNDNSALQKLNHITHTKIMNAALSKMSGHALSFLEVPLLFENGFEKLFDGVIVVLRDLEDRINAVMERDNKSRDDVVARLNSQFRYDNSDLSEYYVIHNDTNFDYLRLQTLNILKTLKDKSGNN